MDSLIKVIPGERFTPYSLAKKLGAKVLLESSSAKHGRARYSLLLLREAFRLRQEGDSVYLQKEGISRRVNSIHRDILDLLVYFANQLHDPEQDFPFPSGGVGFLSYEYSRRFDKILLQKQPDPLNIPEAIFLFGHVWAVFDHFTDMIYLIGMNWKEATTDLEKALAETEARINDGNWEFLNENEEVFPATRVPDDGGNAFLEGVESVRQHIIAGNLLQGVLSRRLEVETALPAMTAYRHLRSNNPSPYLFYLDFGDAQLFGASPEVHVKVRAGMAEIRPIAGTRRRGKDEPEDCALESELLADTKERAEHLMLVDLARNDLGRICERGTIQIPDYYTIERYSHVMHIVSRVIGKPRPAMLGTDALRATFPAGTVSGAPKIRAIEILSGLEPVARRFYAGVVGWVGPKGDLDTCISIRCGWKSGTRLILQAGAGIVYDSTPEREYEETNEKLRALAASVGLEV